MSDRYAYLYEPADKFDFRHLVDDWTSYNITLDNPFTRRITSLSEDGDQFDTSVAMLETAVTDRTPITFQLWLTADTDMCCRIRYLNYSNVVEEYELAGLSREEIDLVFKVLTERFKAKATNARNLFLIADREGYTKELNWDHLSVSGKYEETLCPDILGVSIERSVDFEKCRDMYQSAVQVGDYLILRRTS